MWLFGLLNRKYENDIYIEKSHFVLLVIFLPPEELKMECMTDKSLQFWPGVLNCLVSIQLLNEQPHPLPAFWEGCERRVGLIFSYNPPR